MIRICPFFAGDAMVSEVMAEAGSNMSIGCPGITRNTFVVNVEWRCDGQCGGAYYRGGGGGEDEGSGTRGIKLLRYEKDQGTTLYKNKERLQLEQDMFALEFDPVTALDNGRYICLINNRPAPDAVIKLNVLGKCYQLHTVLLFL